MKARRSHHRQVVLWREGDEGKSQLKLYEECETLSVHADRYFKISERVLKQTAPGHG